MMIGVSNAMDEELVISELEEVVILSFTELEELSGICA